MRTVPHPIPPFNGTELSVNGTELSGNPSPPPQLPSGGRVCGRRRNGAAVHSPLSGLLGGAREPAGTSPCLSLALVNNLLQGAAKGVWLWPIQLYSDSLSQPCFTYLPGSRAASVPLAGGAARGRARGGPARPFRPPRPRAHLCRPQGSRGPETHRE